MWSWVSLCSAELQDSIKLKATVEILTWQRSVKLNRVTMRKTVSRPVCLLAGTEGLASVNHQALGWLSPNTALLIKADALFGGCLSALPPLLLAPSTLPPTIPHSLLMEGVCKGFFSTNSEKNKSTAFILSNSLWPHRLYSPWNSLGQNTGVGSLSLLQGIFPIQGSNPDLPHGRQILYQLNHQGSPRILEWVAYPFSSGSAQPRNWTRVSCIAGRFLTNWAVREDPKCYSFEKIKGKTSLSQTYIGTCTQGPFSRAGTLAKQPSPLRQKSEHQPQWSMVTSVHGAVGGCIETPGKEPTAGIITTLLTQAQREGGPGDASALIKSKTVYKKNQVMKKSALFYYVLKRLDLFLLNFVSHPHLPLNTNHVWFLPHFSAPHWTLSLLCWLPRMVCARVPPGWVLGALAFMLYTALSLANGIHFWL